MAETDNFNQIYNLADAIEELANTQKFYNKSELLFDTESEPKQDFIHTRRLMWIHLEAAERAIKRFKEDLV